VDKAKKIFEQAQVHAEDISSIGEELKLDEAIARNQEIITEEFYYA